MRVGGWGRTHRVLFTVALADTAVAQQQDVARVLEAHEDQRAVLEIIHHVETCRRGARVRRTRARLSGRRVCANLAPAPPAAPRSAGAPFGSTLSHHPCRPRARTRRGESVVWLRGRERSRTRSLAAAAGSAGHAGVGVQFEDARERRGVARFGSQADVFAATVRTKRHHTRYHAHTCRAQVTQKKILKIRL